MKRKKKRKKKLTEADIRALTALRRGALVQTPEGLRCLPVEPTPEERAARRFIPARAGNTVSRAG